MSPPPTLDELGLKHRTDKASTGHDYLGFFDSFFAPLRDEPITLLEIGVFNGASLKTWEEYFSRGKIVGVDYLPSCKRFERGRVKIELADQANIDHLTRVALAHGPFDIIIDDGSHQWDHQIAAVRTLFPFLEDHGLFVVEDLQTNYGAMQAKYRGGANVSCVEFLKNWLDVCVADDAIDLRALDDPFFRTYGRALEFMTFRSRACLMKKKLRPTDWRLNPGPPLAALVEGVAPINVTAHIGLQGDIFGPGGFVDYGSDRFTMQGFAIDVEDNALEYRVRFPDNTWSEWTQDGRYAGTRGKAIPVTGFTVRSRDVERPKYSVRAYGRFVGEEKAVAVADGEDCVAPNGAALRGIQVELIARRG
jgi:hypothetical protein